CERSLAFSAEITLLGWPGAPGCTIGGGGDEDGGGVACAVPAVRHDAAAPPINSANETRRNVADTTCKEYTISAYENRIDRRATRRARRSCRSCPKGPSIRRRATC